MSEAIRDGLVAGSVAAILGGIPSTVHALATGRDPLEATLAAGSVVLRNERSRTKLLLAAAPVHVVLSLAWGIALAQTLPRRPSNSLLLGGVAGVGIYGLDVLVVGKAFPRIRALPRGPQLADHVAFGAVAGAALAWRRR